MIRGRVCIEHYNSDLPGPGFRICCCGIIVRFFGQTALPCVCGACRGDGTTAFPTVMKWVTAVFVKPGSRVWHMGPHESWNLGWLGPAVLQCHFRLDPCGSAKHWCCFFCQWSQCGQKCGFLHSTLASLTSPIKRLHLPCRYKMIWLV